MKVQESLNAVYYSLPFQLFVEQIRYHKLMLLFWVFLFMVVGGNLGHSMGVHYLLLAPEYLGEVNVASLFILGAGMGAFISSFAIGTYINDSYRFHFLALEYRPFRIFFLNAFFLPLIFLILYGIRFVQLQSYLNYGFEVDIIWQLLGFYLGTLVVILLILSYFTRTEKSANKVFGEKIMEEMKSKKVIIGKARAALAMRNRVDFYFYRPFRLAKPDQSLPGDFRALVKILNQNHGNALFLELVFLGTIVGLGLLEHKPAFQFPAGASLLLLFSIVLMLLAAFTFWFRKLNLIALVLLVGVYIGLDHLELFKYRHQAIGMNYEIEPAPYTANRMYQMSSEENFQNDFQNTIRTLNHWKSDYELYHGTATKPRAVLICTSGGGLRAAYLTTRILQLVDSSAQGKLMEKTRLITGASGGMVGAAYFRELHLLNRLGRLDDYFDPALSSRMSRDLLNRVCFKLVSGIFLPRIKVKVGSMDYVNDRGYSFDDQLIKNLEVFQGKRLGDYTELEENAIIPMMVFTPVIIHDGRKLIISSTNVSYLTRHERFGEGMEDGITGIEFRRFFRKQWSDSLWFVTALRMNATFPLITPYVQLPSEPPVKLIDAGVADNYGIQTAARFLYIFRDWFIENTDRVLLLQIRDSKIRTTQIPPYKRKTLLSEFLDPIRAPYKSFSRNREMVNEDYLSFSREWLKGKLDYVCFQYTTADSSETKASLSWHLTGRELEDIEHSLLDTINVRNFRFVDQWLKGGQMAAPIAGTDP